MRIDPRTQDCIGRYLYGSGWFSRDENTLSIITGDAEAPPHFCMTCRVQKECQQRQRRRVRGEHPELMEEFDATVREAKAKGFTPLLVDLALAQRGVNPFYNDALENFGRGHAERGQSAGTMTQSQQEG